MGAKANVLARAVQSIMDQPTDADSEPDLVIVEPTPKPPRKRKSAPRKPKLTEEQLHAKLRAGVRKAYLKDYYQPLTKQLIIQGLLRDGIEGPETYQRMHDAFTAAKVTPVPASYIQTMVLRHQNLAGDSPCAGSNTQ